MTRLQRIAFNKSLRLDASRFEKMTDEQYESEQNFMLEKALRQAQAFRDNHKRKRQA